MQTDARPTTPFERVKLFRAQSALEWEKIRRNPLYWLERYAYTRDERRQHENERPLLHGPNWIDDETGLFPVRELGECHCGSEDGRECGPCTEDDYLRLLAGAWHENDLIAVPKSRQLRVTHLFTNLHGWMAMCFPGQKIAIQSKKAEDADEILERLHVSFQIMRKKHSNISWPTHRRKQMRIIFPNGSILMAVSQGPDKVRQYTFSAIFSDEMAFQADAESAFTAALPTIEGGGKYTAVSSANPSFFEDLVKDEIDRW